MEQSLKLKALIFDIDGTFALTEEAHRAAFNETFQDWGLDWHWDGKLYKELLLVGGSRERIRHYAAVYRPEGAEIVTDDENVMKMYRQKTEIYTGKVSSGQVGLRPGVGRLVQEAMSAGLALGIATTTNMEPLKALFRGTLGLDALKDFGAVAAGDMAAHKKPAPDLYLLALEQLALGAGSCLALEDSRNGLLSADAAGIATVITLNDYSAGQDFTEAVAVISDLGEPGADFRSLRGDRVHQGYVTAGLLAQWHRKSCEGQAINIGD